MYKRCIIDTKEQEPKRMFYLVQFLMYDKENKGFITEEDTLEILYIRHEDRFTAAIEDIFEYAYNWNQLLIYLKLGIKLLMKKALWSSEKGKSLWITSSSRIKWTSFRLRNERSWAIKRKTTAGSCSKSSGMIWLNDS